MPELIDHTTCPSCGKTIHAGSIPLGQSIGRHLDRMLVAHQQGDDCEPVPTTGRYRVGRSYRLHVYEGDRPVATFHDADDAARFVAAMNGLPVPTVDAEVQRKGDIKALRTLMEESYQACIDDPVSRAGWTEADATASDILASDWLAERDARIRAEVDDLRAEVEPIAFDPPLTDDEAQQFTDALNEHVPDWLRTDVQRERAVFESERDAAVKALADQREELATAIEVWCYTHHEIVNDRDVTEMCPRCKNAESIVRTHGAGVE